VKAWKELLMQAFGIWIAAIIIGVAGVCALSPFVVLYYVTTGAP
jgi:hypothetical protein